MFDQGGVLNVLYVMTAVDKAFWGVELEKTNVKECKKEKILDERAVKSGMKELSETEIGADDYAHF